MGSYAVLVTAAFLNSEYAPQVCPFSGRTGGLVRQTYRLNYQYGVHDWWQLISDAEVIQYDLQLYMKPGAEFTRKMTTYAGVFAVLVACVSMLLEVWADAREWLPFWLHLIFAGNAALALLFLFYAFQSRVGLKAIDGKGSIRLTFPEHLKSLQDLYVEAYRNYQFNLGQVASKPADDESWTEAIAPGWDEKRP